MRVEGALEAHFKQPSGESRPGIDWTIDVKRGSEIHRVRVRSYFAEGMTAATRADTTFLGRTVMHYLDDLLRSGWTPAQEREHVITITEPPPGSRPSPRRPWWRFWG